MVQIGRILKFPLSGGRILRKVLPFTYPPVRRQEESG